MLVEQIITERYVNAVGFDDQAMAIKRKYMDQAWDILQQSYAPIGGIKGRGFENPEAMLSLPMWKMGVKDGELKAVIMYKDKGGRKSVAMGTDGSEQSTEYVNDIFRNEIRRSYGEKSKSALGKMMKLVPWDILQSFVVPPEEVKNVLPEDEIIAIKDLDKSEWPTDAQITLNKYPELIDYGYLRELGGNLTFKVMIGTPGLAIK